MANTIAQAWGEDRSRVKETHRLGSESATVCAATWSTFARAHVNRDGSGWVTVKRYGVVLTEFSFGPEDEVAPATRPSDEY